MRVIDAQARVCAIYMVSEFIDAMAEDDGTVYGITQSTITKGYCIKANLDTAFEVFRGMQGRLRGGSHCV